MNTIAFFYRSCIKLEVRWSIASISRQETHSKQGTKDVLHTMVNTRAIDTKARQPCPVANARNVYGALPDRILLGAKTMHNVYSHLPRSSLSHLLQWNWELPLLEQ